MNQLHSPLAGVCKDRVVFPEHERHDLRMESSGAGDQSAGRVECRCPLDLSEVAIPGRVSRSICTPGIQMTTVAESRRMRADHGCAGGLSWYVRPWSDPFERGRGRGVARSIAACALCVLLGHGGLFALGLLPRPNIVWIVAEDASPHIACYGETAIETPSLDRLAEDGVDPDLVDLPPYYPDHPTLRKDWDGWGRCFLPAVPCSFTITASPVRTRCSWPRRGRSSTARQRRSQRLAPSACRWGPGDTLWGAPA